MPIVKRVPAFEGKGCQFIIENVLVDYASVFRPNTRYRPEWAVVIRVPQHLQQEFYEVGFRLKQDPNGNVTLRAKRYVRLDNGDEMSPPSVVDCENNQWPENRGLIGNGSRCNVKVKAKYTTYQGVEGLSCYLEGLQVVDHIPYEGSVQFQTQPGNTGGYQGSGFEQQPQQQQPVTPPAPAPAPQQPAYQPQPTPGQEQGFNPGMPQEAAPPFNPAAVPPQAAQPAEPAYPEPQQAPVQQQPPMHPAQTVPQGAPNGGNVSQPPQGALGSGGMFGGLQSEGPEEDKHLPPVSNNDMGDVPF